MKIIGISASPREGSNSKMALETALEVARENGAETEIFNLNDMDITACQACNYCKANAPKCKVEDDMQKIYKAIEEADGIIFASPIYFYNLSATAKLFIDRLYAYFMFPFAETFGKKKIAMITSQSMPDAAAFAASIDGVLGGLDALGFEVVGNVILTGNNDPGAFEEKDDQVAAARKIGEDML